MQFSLLSICPKIARRDGTLLARTSFAGLVASRTFLHRTVVIDPDRRTISVRRRLIWFFTSRKRIPFDRVEAIVYTHDDWNSNTSWGGADNSADCFTAKLKLWNEHLVHLFHFYGEGTFVNNSSFPDWCFWPEYPFNASGTQESASRTFVDLLQKMLNVPVTRQ